MKYFRNILTLSTLILTLASATFAAGGQSVNLVGLTALLQAIAFAFLNIRLG